MHANDRTHILQGLTESIARRRLLAPARLLLDAITPLGFLAGQVALFILPFTPQGRWREYVMALEDEEGWKVLHGLEDSQES